MSTFSTTSSDSPSPVIIIFPILGILFFFAVVGCMIGAARSRSRRILYPIQPYQPPRYAYTSQPQREVGSRSQDSSSNPVRWSTLSGPNVGGNIVSTAPTIDSTFVNPNRPFPSRPNPAHVADSELERRTASPEPRPRRWESIASIRTSDEELPAYSK